MLLQCTLVYLIPSWGWSDFKYNLSLVLGNRKITLRSGHGLVYSPLESLLERHVLSRVVVSRAWRRHLLQRKSRRSWESALTWGGGRTPCQLGLKETSGTYMIGNFRSFGEMNG